MDEVARIEEVDDAHDIEERALWDEYQRTFSETLSNTSTVWAPWYVLPADRKWFARVAAAAVIADTLIEINPRFLKVARQCGRGSLARV